MPAQRRGAAASVIMFVATGCMSGGWSPLALFAYGLAFSSMLGEGEGDPGTRLTVWLVHRPLPILAASQKED